MTECTLVNDSFDTFIQVILGIIAMSVLAIKRYTERPMRPVQIWMYDASKQAIGAGVAHIANLGIAILLHQLPHTDVQRVADECAFYFVNFAMDTTIGLALNWILLTMFTDIALRCNWKSLIESGNYGTPIQSSIWAKQLFAWIWIIITTKFLLAALIVFLKEPLSDIAIWLFEPLDDHPRAELVIVMIACPCVMNAIQFWIQDNFLKRKTVGRKHSDAKADKARIGLRAKTNSDEEIEVLMANVNVQSDATLENTQ